MTTMVGAVILLAMLVLVPWSGARWYARMKRGDLERTRGYQVALVHEALYALAALVYAALSGDVAKVLPIASRTAPVLPKLSPLLPGLLCGAAIGLVIPLAVPRIRRKLVASAGDASALLPRTANERWLFAAVALAAGLCEELLWRGFLWHFLAHHVPAPLPMLGVAAALVFGLGHLYQGWKGMLGTALAGGAMLLVFLGTGSLLPAIVLHALIDLRAIFLAPGDPLAPRTEAAR